MVIDVDVEVSIFSIGIDTSIGKTLPGLRPIDLPCHIDPFVSYKVIRVVTLRFEGKGIRFTLTLILDGILNTFLNLYTHPELGNRLCIIHESFTRTKIISY